MRTPFRCVLVLPFFAVACTSNPSRDVPAGPKLERYSEEEIVAEMRSLAGKMEFPEDQLREVTEEVEKILGHPDFQAELEGSGVTGVCVFSGGSGGLFISGGSASGLASFKGGRSAVPVQSAGTTVGAVVGGSRVWGVGLLVGLQHESWFPGEYSGTSTGATAVESSVSQSRLASEWHGHVLKVLSVGAGLSATAGHTEVTVKWAE